MEKIKCGLEIHQQLDTHKLFCNCPSILRKDEPDVIVKRKLHAVAGEEGEVDIAVRHEVEKDRGFIYEGYSDTNCLVEYDEEPPHLINSKALQIALHVALLLNCEILSITQIMRKTVINGSNTSGFQRTVLIARNGWFETKKGKVRVDNVSLEEDSAREIGREGDDVVFRLDRLGIPLVEIGTAPDISSAEQCKEAALHIGDVLRSCKVKRGIGTIRQDVNVSIEGHPRIEIKGFQDPKMFFNVIKNEVERQKKNLKDKKLSSEVRRANVDGSTSFLRPMPGKARMYPETDLPLLRITRKMINEAKKTLPKLRGEVREELSKKGLTDEMIKLLLKEGKLEEFESLLKIINEPKFIFKVLIEIPKEVVRHEGKGEDRLSLDVIEDLVDAVANRKIDRGDVKHVMEEIVRGKNFNEAIKIEKIDLRNIEAEIAKIVKDKPGLSIGAYMGLVMKKFKGKVSGGEVSEILKKLINL